MTFSQELYDRSKIEHLFSAHAQDATWMDTPINFNSGAIEYAQDRDGIRCFIVRDGTDIVGYNVFIVSPDMFRMHLTAATEFAIYMKPKYRGHYGRKFIQWVDEQLQFDIIYRGSSERRDIGPVLKRSGYAKIGTIYGRVK